MRAELLIDPRMLANQREKWEGALLRLRDRHYRCTNRRLPGLLRDTEFPCQLLPIASPTSRRNLGSSTAESLP